MGATLGHLLIFDFNITQKKSYFSHTSIDFSTNNAINKSLKIAPRIDLETNIGWESSDQIVRIVCIPGCPGIIENICSPTGFILTHETPTETDLNKIKVNFSSNNFIDGQFDVNIESFEVTSDNGTDVYLFTSFNNDETETETSDA